MSSYSAIYIRGPPSGVKGFSVPIATGLKVGAERAQQKGFAVRSVAFGLNKNVNIHYISSSRVVGLRGLWKLSILVKDTCSEDLGHGGGFR